METLITFLNESDNDVCSFNDDEYIKDLDRQTVIMLWNQIKICFHRVRLNELLYNGHTLASPEVLAINRAIDKLVVEESNANHQYRESQRIINNGGQL